MASKLIFWTFLLSAVCAFTVPADQPDGIYVVDFDGAGTAIITAVDNQTIVPREPLQQVRSTLPDNEELSRRDFPNPQYGCTWRYISDHNAYTSIQNLFTAYLNSGLQVSGHTVHYVQTDNTVLALCNYSDNPQGGSGDEINDFNSYLDTYCGSWETGWVFINDWAKTYWRSTVPGDDICSNI